MSLTLTTAMYKRMLTDYINGRKSDLWKTYKNLSIVSKQTFLDDLRENNMNNILHYIANKQIR